MNEHFAPIDFSVLGGGVPVAHEDGLVIALVREETQLERALQVVDAEILSREALDPGVCGELVLERALGALDLSGWAEERDLANRRIGLFLGDGRPLEIIAQERFAAYLTALRWARSLSPIAA